MEKEKFKIKLLDSLSLDVFSFRLAVLEKRPYEMYISSLVDKLYEKSIPDPLAIQTLHRARRIKYLKLVTCNKMIKDSVSDTLLYGT